MAERGIARNLSAASGKPQKLKSFPGMPGYYQPTNTLALELEKEREIQEKIKAKEVEMAA